MTPCRISGLRRAAQCGGKLEIIAYLSDQVSISKILDHLGLSPPEIPKPPPTAHEVVRLPVDALEQKSRMIEESLREIERLHRNEREVTRTLQGLDQMKTNFMIVTSHELRTPLTVLRGYVEALLEGFLGALSAEQRHCLDICRRTLDRMVASSNEILLMLELEQGRMALLLAAMDLEATASKALRGSCAGAAASSPPPAPRLASRAWRRGTQWR